MVDEESKDQGVENDKNEVRQEGQQGIPGLLLSRYRQLYATNKLKTLIFSSLGVLVLIVGIISSLVWITGGEPMDLITLGQKKSYECDPGQVFADKLLDLEGIESRYLSVIAHRGTGEDNANQLKQDLVGTEIRFDTIKNNFAAILQCLPKADPRWGDVYQAMQGYIFALEGLHRDVFALIQNKPNQLTRVIARLDERKMQMQEKIAAIERID